MEATQVKNDELQLCYDLKRESAKKIEELQKIINKLTDIPKSQIKAKRDLRNVLCDKCRGKPYGVLNLPLLSFAQVGCQTDSQLSDLELSQISKTETYDAKNGSAKQNISAQSITTRGQGKEEQDTVQIRTETTLSEQIKRLTAEKKELQGSLKSQQEIIQKHEAVLESKHGELTALKMAFSKTIERLTSENVELKNNLKSQQQTVRNLRTMPVEKDEQSFLDDGERLKRKVLVMRLLRTSQSGVGKTMMENVTDVLARQVGGRLDLRHFDFTIDLPDTSTGVSKGPLFVVCLNSMVGKNVPDALEGPKGGRDVYMLVLHQTTRANLSTLRRTSLRNNGSEIRQLGGVIDMVFSSESGLLECDFNSTAVAKIVTVLKNI